MSAIRSADQGHGGGTGANIEIPSSFTPDADTLLISADSRAYEFPAASSTFSPMGTSQIVIPQHKSRYILGGSSFLNFKLRVTATIQMSAYQPSVTPLYNAALFFGGGPTKSACGLIDRVTITAANGQVLADISNYAQWHNLILCHGANEDYSRNASISENAFTPLSVNINPNVGVGIINMPFDITTDIQIPLAVGLLNEVKAFPLWALNGPLIVLIQWNTVQKSINACLVAQSNQYETGLSANTPSTFSIYSSNYSGSNLSLRARCVDVDIDYINQQRLLMAQGRVLTFNYRQTQNLVSKLGPLGDVSFNFGLNVSSLLSVFGINILDKFCSQQTASSVQLGLGDSAANYGSWGYSANLQKNIRIFRDGTQLSAFALNNGGADDAFLPLMEAMGVTFSTSNASIAKRVTAGGALNFPEMQYVPNAWDNNRVAQGAYHGYRPSTVFSLPVAWQYGNYEGGSVYSPAAYAWGQSTRVCNDANIANRGSQCSQLQINIESGSTRTGYLFVFYTYSCSVSFDGTGNVIVRR